jgi:hypothetical protein
VFAPANQDNTSTCFDKALRDREPDSGTAASDQGNFVIQPKRIHSHSRGPSA